MSQKNIFILIIALLVVGIFATIILRSQKKSFPILGQYDTFAQCLATKKLTMYGAVWCSHCKEQKALFGESFKFVPYVECSENPQACMDKGVQGYPTWIDEKGEKYVGKQSLEKLSQITGCVL
ncbi:MAG: thioredoxin domain-containing protein [Candidatus Parcubacteria bacterium]|nr:thioredoxin domain-containing protein [Candidatus Parcubacteria bacterium]